jgi:hypothetical protein
MAKAKSVKDQTSSPISRDLPRPNPEGVWLAKVAKAFWRDGIVGPGGA